MALKISSSFSFPSVPSSFGAAPDISETYSSKFGTILKAPLTAFNYALDVLDTPRNVFTGLLAGEPGVLKDLIPFGQDVFGLEVPKVSGRELLETYGVLGENQEGFDAGDVAGFVADVGLDPLTYMGIGALSKVGKLEKAGKGAATRIEVGKSALEAIKPPRNKFGQFIKDPERVRIRRIIAEESDQLAKVEKQLGTRMPDDILTVKPERSISFAGKDIFTFRGGPKTPRFLEPTVKGLKNLFQYAPENQFAAEALELSKRLERLRVEGFEQEVDKVRTILRKKGKTPQDLMEYVETVYAGGDLKTQEEVISEINQIIERVTGDSGVWSYDLLPGAELKAAVRRRGEKGKFIKGDLPQGEQIYKDTFTFEKGARLSRKERSQISKFAPEAQFDELHFEPGYESEVNILQNREEVLSVLSERLRKIEEFKSQWDDESISLIQDLYVHQHNDLLRNMNVGVREAILQDPTIGYVHHLLTGPGKQLLEESPELQKEIVSSIANIVKKNLPAKKRTMRGTVNEINNAVRKLDATKEWARKRKVDLNTFKYFEDDFYKTTAARASTSAARFMEMSYAQNVFNNFGKALDDGMISLPDFIKEMKIRRWGDVTIKPGMKTSQIRATLKKAGHDVNIGLDRALYDDMRKPFKYFTNDKDVGQFVAAYDSVHNFYKGMFTVLFPQFHTRNLMGNIWNSVILGKSKVGDHIEAGSIIKRAFKAQKDQVSPLSVLNKKEQRWYLEAVEAGVFRNEQDYITDLRDIGTFTQANERSGWFKKALNTGHNVAHNIESASRLGHYISMRKQGQSLAEAAASVRKYLFNYNELTAFEKGVMKRGIFFYTFTRKNTPLVVEHFTNPYARAWAAAVGKTDEKPEEMPQWMWDSNMLFRGIDDSGRATGLNLGVPINDPFTTLRKPLSMMTPLLSGPLQMTADYDFFRGKPISQDTIAPKLLQTLASENIPKDFLNDLVGLRVDSRGVVRIDPGVKAALRFSPIGRFFNQEIEGLETVGKMFSPVTKSYGTPDKLTNRQKAAVKAAKRRGLIREFPLMIGEGQEGKALAKTLNKKMFNQ
jgi:hypothetical protein